MRKADIDNKALPVVTELRKTICNRDCPDTCGVVATVVDGRIVKLAGDPEHPITGGFLCHRTNQFLRRQYSPERLTTPLLRKDGVLTPVSYDEALDLIARSLLRIRAQYGPAAIFHYRSGGSLGILKVLSDYFFELFGPVTIKRGDICSGAGEAAQELDFGVSDSSDARSLLASKHIFLWGKNVHTSSPHLIPTLKEAQKRGAQVVLIDPVAHAGVKLADHYHQLAPGGDLSLALAIARLLFERGQTDPRGPEYCDNWGQFRALAMSRSIEEWCREAGVDSAHDLASRLADKPCAILVGWGMGRRSRGGAIVRALDALSAISGNLGIEGGGASFYFPRRRAFDSSFVRGIEAAPRTVAEPLFARLGEFSDPAIRALWVTAGNPVAMLPDSQASVRAIRGLELSVVVDPFLTDTARVADVVLPTRTMLEEDDVLGAYGHSYLGVSRPVVPSALKSDLEIVQALAERVGLAKELAGTAEEWKQRLLKHGITVADLQTSVMRDPDAARVLFADRRFATASGRVNLMTSVPSPSAEYDPEFPLMLHALSTPKSQSSQWVDEAPRVLEATVHPDSTTFADGARARLQSRIGSIDVVIKHDRAQRRDVVIVPKGGHHYLAACANSLLDAKLTDIGDGGVLYEQAVRLVART